MTILEELKQTAVDGDAPYERAMAAKAAAEIERLTRRVAEMEQDMTRRRENQGCIAGACPMCGRPLVIG